MTDFSLPPSGARARAIDLRMRQSLADSLDYIGSEIRPLIDFNQGAMAELSGQLRRGARFTPSIFALYTELVLALESGETATAASIIAELLEEREQPQAWRLLALDDAELAIQAPRYRRFMSSDPSTEFNIVPPSLQTAAQFRQRFARSHQLLRTAIPELAAEFDALVSQVIMVEGNPTAKYQFDGGSSYMLWGGLFLNASSHVNDVALIEVMAHESAHILLFGYASDEALVNNDDDTLYHSPLRVDPRPMDGIFHATYVSARMHWAMSTLIASGVLDEESREFARVAMLADQQNFAAGYGVVEQHGDLTATGQAVMQGAFGYMDSVKP